MGVVYLLCEYGSNPEKYKIGVTKGSPIKRIKSLQTGCSNEIILINSFESKFYLKIESFLHRKYHQYSTDGGTEWFELPSEIVNNFKKECESIELMYDTLISNGNPFII